MRFDPLQRLAVYIWLSSAATAGPILYQITDLGSLGGANASANGINASGQTTGTRTDAYGAQHAFSSGTDITPAAGQALGAAINAGGQIAGTALLGGTAFGAIWTSGSVQYLSADSYAMGINDPGEVTGSAQGHAFLLTAGVMTDLGVLRGGNWSSGYSVNNAGQVAGYGDVADGAFRAFTTQPGGGMTALGTLGGANSYAFGINGAGLVTGSAQTGSGYLHAALWNGSSVQDLGTLGGLTSYGYGIDTAGAVVGYSQTGTGARHAFLYQNGGMRDLNSLLTASGWELTAAYAINDNGQIAGSGIFNGVEHAFRLDPQAAASARPGVSLETAIPEPGTIGTVLVGMVLLLRRAPHSGLK